MDFWGTQLSEKAKTVMDVALEWFAVLHVMVKKLSYIYIYIDVCTMITSSTAQGGGGSFRIGNL